jgi:hypothetical protein
MEPLQLKRGKVFHRIVQQDFDNESTDGNVNNEYVIHLLPLNRSYKRVKSGRLDIFIDDLGEMVTVIEIKSTEWDNIKNKNVKKLLSSHRRQIWKYMEKYLDHDNLDVCAAIIYPRSPKSINLKNLVEKYLNSYGLQVVWYYD